jgi:hypothetical protein
MTFAIEKNIPLAPVVRKESDYPFALLEVGDSFLVPATAEDYQRVRQHVASYAHRQHKVFKTGKYCTRKAEGGVRVWRTA